MSTSLISFDTRELRAAQRAFVRLGSEQSKIVRKAAQKGSNIVGKNIRSNVPRGETGMLKKGFEKKRERSHIANKAMYNYAIKSSMNNVFQKPIKNPGALGGKQKYWGYYPNSVEYGFLARAKGGGIVYRRIGRRNDPSGWDAYSTNPFLKGGRKGSHVEIVKGWESKRVEGQHPVKKAAEQSQKDVEVTIAKVFEQEVSRIMK